MRISYNISFSTKYGPIAPFFEQVHLPLPERKHRWFVSLILPIDPPIQILCLFADPEREGLH